MLSIYYRDISCQSVLIVSMYNRLDVANMTQYNIIVDTYKNKWQNKPTVEKVSALFKIFSIKNVVKSKGAAKKWLWWYRLMAKTLITIQDNFDRADS